MSERIVLGLSEEIILIGNNGKEERLIARIDSGATASSIDAALAEKMELGPITRSKIVKSASGVERRPMILAKIKIHEAVIESEFTLADRAHLKYSMLIGQNILKSEKFMIDPLKEVTK